LAKLIETPLGKYRRRNFSHFGPPGWWSRFSPIHQNYGKGNIWPVIPILFGLPGWYL